MIMKIRITSLVLALACLLLSCAKTSFTDPEEARENAVRDVNQYRYSPLDFAFPEEYSISPVAPLVGGDGSVTLVLQRESYENHAYTLDAMKIETAIFTFSEDGTVLREEKIPLGDKVSVLCGILTEESLHFAAALWGKGHHCFAARFDRTAQELSETVNFGDIPRMSATMTPPDMAQDAEGNIYLLDDSGKKIVSLNAEYGDYISFISHSPVSGLIRGEDGFVYALSSEGGSVSLKKADRQTGSFSETRTLDFFAASRGAVRKAGKWLYYPTPDGVHRVDLSVEKAADEKVLDYTSSGILTQSSIEGWGQFAGVIREDLLLFAEMKRDEYGVVRKVPQIYEKVPEQPDGDCTVVEVAYACELEDIVRTEFVLFNRAHDDIRIVTLDYCDYGNSMNRNYGSWKMMTDIKNGLIAPDIVIDRRGLFTEDEEGNGFDASPMKQLTDGGLTVGLGGFLDRDPVVNRENLFGCVLRAFSDRDGELWGIAPYFGLRMWLTLPEFLDGYAADGRWTVGEFLDYYEGLPEGSVPCIWCTSDTWANGLLSDLASFYDEETGVCRFNSEEFVRCLRILSSLPDEKTYLRTSPYAEANLGSFAPRFRDGTIRLCPAFLYDVSALLTLDPVYGTKDYSLVGYPSHLSSGARLESDLVFMICKTSPDPEAAWELIRTFFLDETLNRSAAWDKSVSLPALKSSFDAQVDYYNSIVIRRYSDGSIGLYEDPGQDDRTGMRYTEEKLDRELVTRIRAYLDNEGAPLLEQTPDAVRDIVAEELSAFRAGLGTAEDCAKKIQSRASIWKAEHE